MGNKETLEEAAKEYLFEVYQKQFIVKTNDIQHGVLKGFIEGAKWLQERSHSNIEQKWNEYRRFTNNEDAWCFKEWLVEQFKKK